MVLGMLRRTIAWLLSLNWLCPVLHQLTPVQYLRAPQLYL
jgi:hypothetical protein